MKSLTTKILSFTIILIITGLAVSCASTLRQELLDEHPEWSDKYVEMIKNGNITEGMTKDMVRAAWGHPKMNSEVTESSYSTQWVYETGSTNSYSSTYVYFKDGKVVSIDTGND